jgi:glycosyltransferase involved in cell wall biosynthesis
MHKILVFHFITDIHISSGGPSRSVTHLTEELSKHKNINIKLFFQKIKNEKNVKNVDSQTSKVKKIFTVVKSNCELFFGFKIGLKFLKEMHKKKCDIVHLHGIWLPIYHFIILLCQVYKVPYIIHTRGMLEPWSLGNKSYKKKLAFVFYQKNDLKNANLIITTSYQEMKGVRALGLKNPIAIIPNGVLLNNKLKNVFKKSESKSLLFLSRLDKKKGLFLLLRAWSLIDKNNWILTIAGPSEINFKNELISLALKLNILPYIKFIDQIDGVAKDDLYLNADLFILPSFSENFGLVVVEALSFGVPVITTKSTPWEDVEKFNCGWWIDLNVESLQTVLSKAMTLSDYERRRMGKNGINYIQKYAWPNIADQTIESYFWLLGLKKSNKNIIIKQ